MARITVTLDYSPNPDYYDAGLSEVERACVDARAIESGDLTIEEFVATPGVELAVTVEEDSAPAVPLDSGIFGALSRADAYLLNDSTADEASSLIRELSLAVARAANLGEELTKFPDAPGAIAIRGFGAEILRALDGTRGSAEA